LLPLLVRLLGEVEVTAHHHIVASSAQLKQITVNSTDIVEGKDCCGSGT
jgi:hypothetical protein